MLTIQHCLIKTDLNRVLVNDLSFSANSHDRIAIIGEEGNGKSTLLKAIGSIPDAFLDQCTVSMQRWPSHCFFGYLKQNLAPDDLVMSAQAFVLMDGGDEREFARLAAIHLSNLTVLDMDRPMRTFSGGEKVKLQLIRLMLAHPDVYLLDEPTNDLDLETLDWLETWMMNQREPILFVSHDVYFLKQVSTQVIHLEQRKRKQEAHSTYAGIPFAEYMHERSQMILKTNQVARKEHADHHERLQRWQQLYQKVDHAQATVSRSNAHGGQLLKKHMRHLKAQKRQLDQKTLTSKIEPEEALKLNFDFNHPERRKGILFEKTLDSLSIGNHLLGNNYHLQIHYGEKLGLIGANGVGKSVYLEQLCEWVGSQGISFAFMPQDYFKRLDIHQQVVDFVASSSNKQDREHARDILGSLKLTVQEMEGTLFECSLGMIAKLYLARCALSDVSLLILDEPTRNLSPLSLDAIIDLFRSYQKTVLVVSHDREFLNGVCTRKVEMTADGFQELAG